MSAMERLSQYRSSEEVVHKAPRVHLMATEMATNGGIQTFMCRIAEAFDASSQGVGVWSLNDSVESLRARLGQRKAETTIWGAAGSKIRYVVRLATEFSRPSIAFVGHVGLAPVAMGLKSIGLLHSYAVILHGIEAWKRLAIVDRVAVQRADLVIATTEFTASTCADLNHIEPSRLRIVPLSVSAAETLEATRDIAPRARPMQILCVARLDPSERYKGVEHLLEAVSRLKKVGTSVRLKVVGDGEDRQRLELAAKILGVSDEIEFAGRLDDRGLDDAYCNCDVFAMPSKKEGFGIVFLEAMARGKPCIGGRHGGTPEVILDGVTGFLVEYGDIDSLVGLIARLDSDEECVQRMGAAGRERLLLKYTFESFAASYRALGTELAA